MIRRFGLIAAMTLAAGAPVGAAEAAARREEPAASAHQDLLLLGPLEPLRVRLMIEIDGIPFRDVWRDAFERQFDLYDSDGDGFVTPQQAESLMAAFRRGPASASLGASSAGAMMAAKNESKEELRRRIESFAPPISLRQSLSSGGAGPALIPLLDADGDGRLSHDELSNAENSLHVRDFNDDQLITQQELIAGPSLNAQDGEDEASAGDGAVVLLNEGLDASAVAEILLARYDRNRDGYLSLVAPAEVISGEGGVADLDADGDRQLSRQELRGFLDLPVDALLPQSFGSTSRGRRQGEANERYRLQRKLDGGFRLHVGSSQINFGRNNRDPSKDGQLPRFRDFDADNNKSLDANELMNVPDRPEFSLLDADGDGSISQSEFDDFILQRARIAAVQLVLEVSDAGADLFTLLDRNVDDVLTPRELSLAPQVLQTEDLDGDGYLGGAEMSYSLALILSRGGPRTTNNDRNALRRDGAVSQIRVDRQGPDWFLKMDRNRDGDVSLSEFLGSRQTFRELDKDANGLLSADEVP